MFTRLDDSRIDDTSEGGLSIDLFLKRHGLVHNGGFQKFEALYCSLNVVGSTEIS